MDLLTKISRKELVRGPPNISFDKDHPCETCKLEKQGKSSFKSKDSITTTRSLQLLHLGLAQTQSLDGKLYVLIMIDDYSRFTWSLFLHTKNEAFL